MPEQGEGFGTRGAARPALAGVVLLAIAGCVQGVGPDVGMLGFGAGRAPAEAAMASGLPGSSLDPQKAVGSDLIADLQARRSILPPDGPYRAVADSVIAASSGAAAAELRVARLKADARSKNWLPQIGPRVDLSSLGALAGSLILEQVIFDNGRRKAERAFAVADVEVAAVTLSADINNRVYTGLSHYIEAERARARAEIASRAAGRLAGFADIMRQRVEGGLSDRSEKQVLDQKLAEMRATHAADREAEATALAELAAMSSGPVAKARGLQPLPPDSAAIEPLSVLRARGEGARSVAGAQVERAGRLPGLSANASVTGDGVDGGLVLGSDGLFGLGTGAELKALAAASEVADRRTAEAAETANRHIVSLSREIIAIETRQREGAEVLRQTAGNFEMFAEQYKVGRRSLLELVGQYDAYSRLERDQATLAFDAALLRLEIARDRGLLVDGARM